ncbi:alpha/beta fold hydrolase [Streptomyces sp. XH2]|uniref:alpha/beta fold hydrolase n=1 Tax=Streptomyces sp. XH2 TaxID=3412483 RepID=UPI003C7BADDA
MEQMVSVRDGEVWADDAEGAGKREGRETGGLPLVLLHPGVADSRIWDPVLPRLVERHRVIRFDVRGYGNSPAPTAKFSVVEDLVAVLDHFGLSRVALAGSSMGGAAAVNLALADPARVAALALLVPGVTGYEGLAVPGFMAEVERLAAAGDMDGLVALALRTFGAAGTDGDEEAAAHVRSAIRAWLTNHPHQVQDAPAFDRLGELDVPCVLALGEQDRPEVIRCNEEMAARIPGCRLVRLAGSDHLPTLREPEAVASLILEACEGLVN